MKARVHVFVSGLVQGVCFRSAARDAARRLGLKGFVRNIEHGRVEVIFEGEKEKILEIIKFCKRGPAGAHVTNVDIKWENFKAEFSGFEVKY